MTRGGDPPSSTNAVSGRYLERQGTGSNVFGKGAWWKCAILAGLRCAASNMAAGNDSGAAKSAPVDLAGTEGEVAYGLSCAASHVQHDRQAAWGV